MKKTVRRFLSLMLAAACAVSVVAINPAEVYAKNKYKKGDYITSGSYEQDGDNSNGAEPIEWEVLAVKGEKALVISRYILDVKPYNEKDEVATWEKCTLRKWLNKDFYNSAFNDDDKKKIVKTKLLNPDNKSNGTKGGKTTKDRVFILSVPEIQKYYKYNAWYEENMYGYSQALMADGTKYATNKGLWTWTMTKEYYNSYKAEGYNKSCIDRTPGLWWMRSQNSNGACIVNTDGGAGWNNYCPNLPGDCVGVRPAMWIKL